MLEAILGLGVLAVSVVLHENAHGWMALALGDDTARSSGRLTLNPIKHVDIFGTLILPAMLFFSVGSMFGYAKPVPVNPAKLQGKDRWGFAVVALAGPVSNLVIAFASAMALRVLYGVDVEIDPIVIDRGSIAFFGAGQYLLSAAFTWNVLLAAFNLIPIPPLDGSRLLRIVLSANGRRTLDRVEPYGFLILFAIIVWMSEPLGRVIELISSGLLRILPL